MKLKVMVQAESVGGFSVSVPALPGCYSEGNTLDEALANIREAAEIWLEVTAEAAEACNLNAELQEIEL
jgi:predicted RNase H-like HicB family nuclease